MIPQGKFDSKFIGTAFAALGLLTTLVITIPLVFLAVVCPDSLGDKGFQNVALYISTPALILFIVGIRMTARVSEKFYGVVLMVLGLLCLYGLISYLVHFQFSDKPGEGFAFSYIGIFFSLGAYLVFSGISRLTGRRNKNANPDLMPITKETSVLKGASNFFQVLIFGLFVFAAAFAFIMGLMYLIVFYL